MALQTDERGHAARFMIREARPGSRRGEVRVSRCGRALMRVDLTKMRNVETLAILAPNGVVLTTSRELVDLAANVQKKALLLSRFSKEALAGMEAISQERKEALRWINGQ